MDEQTQLEIDAAAFRRLRDHLRNRTDVQNIDMMNLAGFCRNCLSRWVQEAAGEKGFEISKEQAREDYYGMPFDEWRDKYQTEATDAQKDAFKKKRSVSILSFKFKHRFQKSEICVSTFAYQLYC